jgi:hypothetical protein
LTRPDDGSNLGTSDEGGGRAVRQNSIVAAALAAFPAEDSVRAPLIFSLVILLAGAVMFAPGCEIDGDGEDGPPTEMERFAVTGLLYARPAISDDSPEGLLAASIFLPDIEVRLQNEETGGETDPVVTDLSGRFEIPPQEPGTYRLCWRADGFVSSCGEPFELRDEHLFLGEAQIDIERPPDTKAFHGSVRFADGTNPRAVHPMENVDAFVRVSAVDASGTELVKPVIVNDYGRYLIPAVPVGAPGELRFEIEGTTETVAITPASLPAGQVQRLDITLKNRRPVLEGLVGDTGAGKRWTAVPGSTISVNARARDPDGDPLKVRWLLPDGSSVPHAQGGASIQYSLPNQSATHVFEAVVYDGKGGYASDYVPITTEGVRFSGRVVATSSAAVTGAVIEVGGQTATTATDGSFQLVVPERPRYVFNVRKPGYQLLSRIYDRGVLGGEWTLTRASVVQVDPTQDIDVTNTRIPSDCPGPLSEQFERKQDRLEQEGCGPGIRVLIPANSLVDADGNPPTGQVDIELATIDVRSPDGMLGDYTAIDQNGDQLVMETLGAGWVEIRDGGSTYDLAPGAVSELIIPIPATQLVAATIPNSVPLLSYDEGDGVWREEGQAQRVGNAFVAKVRHLSAFNIDLLFQNQACVRVDAVAMPQPKFNLQVEVPSASGGPPTVKTVTVENDKARFHVLYNLPTNTAMKLRAFEVNGTPITLALPNPTNVNPPPTGLVLDVTTGAKQDPVTPNLPPFPYTACKGFSGPAPNPNNPNALPSAVLVPATLPTQAVNQFLYFRGFGPNLTADPTIQTIWEDQARDYYDTVDPLKLRESVAEFRQRNGFGQTGQTEVIAAYANSADLGFGREMHCTKRSVSGLSGFDVACYVTNYGNKDTDDLDDFQKALAAKTSGTPTDAIATVGMEYSRIEDPSDSTGATFVSNTRVVKFYVWKQQDSPRLPSADLDGFGARPVPQLCMVCHAGVKPASVQPNANGTPNWQTASDVNLGSRFIAFDLAGFTMDAATKASQQPDFKALNDLVEDTNPGQPILDAIADMDSGGNVQKEVAEIGGWGSTSGTPSEKDMYREVIAPSCRACHFSQAPSSIDWAEASDVAARDPSYAVCFGNYMPHAVITHRRFWLDPTSPRQPSVFADYIQNLNSNAPVQGCRP